MIIMGKKIVETSVHVSMPQRVKNTKRLITMHRRILDMYRNEYINYDYKDDDYKEYIALAIIKVESKLEKLQIKLNRPSYQGTYHLKTEPSGAMTIGDIILSKLKNERNE